MDGILIEAAAPQVVQPIMDAIQQLVALIADNANVLTALRLIGAIVIVICVALLVSEKWWPDGPLGKFMDGVGKKGVGWAIAGCALGLIAILPAQILPIFAGLLGYLFQFVLNIITYPFNM